MKRAFLRAVMARRAAITLRWRATLEQAPLYTPLATPALLAHMMDRTLDELILTIKNPKVSENHSGRHDPLISSKSCSTCGLNPYIGYFLAGEAALVSAIRSIETSATLSENDLLGSEIELLFAFRVIAHREVNDFCEICWIEHPSASFVEHSTLPGLCPFKTMVAEMKATNTSRGHS